MTVGQARMSTSADWYLAARERCASLAHEMVRLERLADSFEADGLYTRADAVRWDRNDVQFERSCLLRDVWRRRRQGRVPQLAWLI